MKEPCQLAGRRGGPAARISLLAPGPPWESGLPNVPSRLEVVHLVAPAPVGGAETVIATLSAGLAARGHDVIVGALLGPSEPCPAFVSLPGLGVQLREIRVPPRAYRAEQREIRRLLGGRPSAVVHTHGYHANVIGGAAARAWKRVATVHGYTGAGAKNRVYEWLDRRMLRGFDAVISVAAPLRDQLLRQGLAAARLHLVPNAVGASAVEAPDAARARLGLPPDVAIVGWVGRVTWEKGPDLFLDALGELAGDVMGAVVGDGALRPNLEKRAVGRGPGLRVRWHGTVPAAASLLRAFDALVLTSRTEGTPMVVLEAMAAGVPVVATAVGGVPDLLDDECAVLVRELSGRAIAAGVERCLEDPVAAARRAERARQRVVRDFGVAPWLDRHERIYRDLA